MNQHNKRDVERPTELLADLPLPTEQAEEAKAGGPLFQADLCGQPTKAVIHLSK